MSYTFYAFGLTILSDWSLPCHSTPQQSFAEVRLGEGTDAFFAERVPAAHRHPVRRVSFHRLADGCSYLHWRNQFEFHFSADGRRITGLSLDGKPDDSFRSYMLGHVLSHALLNMGVETIHAANVEVGGQVIALMGDSAYGKSTLTASFLQEGHKLLSDDFMVVRRIGDEDLVFPGLPRIKLYERVAQHLAPQGQKGMPMYGQGRSKMVYPVSDAIREPFPLRAFYALASPKAAAGTKGVRIERLTEREAYLELTKNSFNTAVVKPERLASQFQWATELVKRIPVQRLYYPRVLSVLPEVIAAVREDLGAQGASRPAHLAATLPSRIP